MTAEGVIDGTRLQRAASATVQSACTASDYNRLWSLAGRPPRERLALRDYVEEKQEMGHALQLLPHRLIVAQLIGKQKHIDAV